MSCVFTKERNLDIDLFTQGESLSEHEDKNQDDASGSQAKGNQRLPASQPEARGEARNRLFLTAL